MGTMKLGKEDEKSMRPMFPRVHVSDTDKGGPRAPPRNKMALYEQLSVPSQKYSSTATQQHKPGNAIPSASAVQGPSHERTASSPFYLPYSTTAPSTEMPCSHDGRSVKSRGMENEGSFKSKYDDDNDDFRVPILAQPEGSPQSKDAPLVEITRTNRLGAINAQISTAFDSSIHGQSSSRNPINESNTFELLSKKRKRLNANNESRDTISRKDHGYEFPNNIGTSEIVANPSKISPAPSDQGTETNIKFLDKAGCQSAKIGKMSSFNGSVDSHCFENRNAYKLGSQLCSGASFGYSQLSYDDKANAERSDEASEASMIDYVSELDISPDDVVGVIGPKQFWKARRAIVNQQRVFAIQVFELHRLIKVQKEFAESPHLLLEDCRIITIQPKVATKILPVASNVKHQQVGQQGDHYKPSQNADPLVEKAASPPLQPQERDPNQELGQPIRNLPHAANPFVNPMATDNRPNPWCFQPPANQWLIPVMSPSEGLVYKPYTGSCPPTAGFMTHLYGPYGGPLSMPPSAYGAPSSHQQPNHNLPCVPPIAPTNYYPSPYGMPMMNPVISASAVDQGRPLTKAIPSRPTVQQSQNSRNVSVMKSEAVTGYPPKKDGERQVSTGSSPCDRPREGRDMLPIFPSSQAAEESCQPSQSSGRENQTHVIRVVPHNARSATESAARIFRSIQKERQQFDL